MRLEVFFNWSQKSLPLVVKKTSQISYIIACTHQTREVMLNWGDEKAIYIISKGDTAHNSSASNERQILAKKCFC